ncbi:hypothetical protein VTK73DRAFT_5345 [Phialemonium thermophilum]|uniref:Uncharacterized protein n=1 Tax=Phialemonium thermophilum TaxID=223376 RepID=A0ABR3Y946_9PEZI
MRPSRPLPLLSSRSPCTLVLPQQQTQHHFQHTAILLRPIHSEARRDASVAPIYGTGPPPDPPVSEAASRRTRQAEMLRRARDLRMEDAISENRTGTAAAGNKKAGLLKKRFWQDVHVKEVDGAYEVHLDTRALRHPSSKQVIRLPLSKPHLAHALALEWDLLTSAQQATKQHLIPLTSLVCRALDIADDDAAHEQRGKMSPSSSSFAPIRTSIADTLLRYFDTDTLLCLAPPPEEHEGITPDGSSLRTVQESVLRRVASYLTSRVWPGVQLRPVLDGSSILPCPQHPGVREVVQGWIMGLGHWELAGLERATLAGKGLLGAARLVAEWSEDAAWRGAVVGDAGSGATNRLSTSVSEHQITDEGTDWARFGVEEAAQAASVEVDWQTRRWGEVEDTHDVEKEDIRRQFGSVVLLVSGTGRGRMPQS